MRSFRLRSGASMPAIGLGTWQSKPGEVGKAVQHALELGYKHIDCAAIYENEKEIGNVFVSHFKSHPRGDFFITSKLWNTEHHPSRVKAACQKTLNDLQLEYLDLYLIHWPLAFDSSCQGMSNLFDKEGKLKQEKDVTLLDTWRAMEQLVEAGMCKHIGVSNFTIQHLQELLPHTRVPISVNQVELHPYLPQTKLLQFCKMNDILVTAYSPLGSGRDPSLLEDPVVKAVAQEQTKTPAQILIQWAVQRETVVIPKSVTPSRIKENFVEFTLTTDQMERLGHIQLRHRYINPSSFWRVDLFDDDKLNSNQE